MFLKYLTIILINYIKVILANIGFKENFLKQYGYQHLEKKPRGIILILFLDVKNL
jgi:hypothetical protein